MRVIVYNRFSDGGVSVCTPAQNAIDWMSCGGRWNGEPRGYLDALIERGIALGRKPDVARRYVHAMQFGGCTTAEALEIIRDRDCAPHGTAIELWDRSQLPPDRWFRNAWRRSHNGGPVEIDLKKARPIQLQHIRTAAAEANRKQAESIGDDWGAAPIEPDIGALNRRLMAAKEIAEIRSIWPIELTEA